MSNQIYILTHGFELSEEQEEVKLIGVYATQEEAEAAQRRALERRGFKEHPDGFYIQAYELNRDHFTEGFDPETGEVAEES
jgi:hypothetical protein